jgi:hypothetical protein
MDQKKEIKMIFSACPYCDESQVFGWEAGMPGGWFPSRCHKCDGVMWVEATSFGGETITHETFKKEIMRPGDEDMIEEAFKEAINHSNVVYDE